MIARRCTQCPAVFQSPYPWQKYCSKACQEERWRVRAPRRPGRERCLLCPAPLPKVARLCALPLYCRACKATRKRESRRASKARRRGEAARPLLRPGIACTPEQVRHVEQAHGLGLATAWPLVTERPASRRA